MLENKTSLIDKIAQTAYRIVIFYKKNPRVISVFCAILGLSLFMLLVSYNPHDLSQFYAGSKKTIVHNIFGKFGAEIAAWLIYFFGMISYIWVVFFWYLAWYYWHKITVRIEAILAFICLPFILASLSAWYHAEIITYSYPGGWWGNLVQNIFITCFDDLGATIAMHLLFSICIMLIVPHRVFQVAKVIAYTSAWLVTKNNGIRPIIFYTQRIWYAIIYPIQKCTLFMWRLIWASPEILQDQSIVEFEQYYLDESDVITNDFIQSLKPKHQKESMAELNTQQAEIKIVETDSVIQEKNVTTITAQTILSMPTPKLYKLPDLKKFSWLGKDRTIIDRMQELKERAKLLEEKLARFGILGNVVSIKQGPVVTLFEYQPHIDSKISKIIALEDDLALALQALSIRIIAPIPGRSVVGFEVANQQRTDVLFSAMVAADSFTQFNGGIPLILGEDTVGNQVVVDLVKMPHLLVAGSTGSGKSVALNAMLMSMLCARTPEQLKLILIDPKRLEFAPYADIAHLLFPIITNTKQVAPILKWVVRTMEERYEMMSRVGARNSIDYNNYILNSDHNSENNYQSLPWIVVIIDELADLMMTTGRDVEDLIARIAQMARAAGIHMIVATQRPSVDVITGLIKVNFPSRISFRVTSKIDSRTILDCGGADKLLGKGDMLFLDSSSAHVRRIHGAYVTDRQISDVVAHVRAQQPPNYHDISQELSREISGEQEVDEQLIMAVRDYLQHVDEVSISLLQRKFRIGYNRSARVIELLESQGLIMPADSGKMRKVVR